MNLVELLKNRALEQPQEVAFTFLEYEGNNRKEIDLTLKNVYDNARAIAVELMNKGVNKGDRIIIISTQKFDNIYSIYGALFAGAVFILVPPPLDENKQKRFDKVLSSSDAKFVLGDNLISGMLKNKCEIVNIDNIDTNPEDWKPHNIENNDLAYLQYSSGSTNFPKGVMISHKNVRSNLESLVQFFEHKPLGTTVSWVPFFHNIGLVAFVFLNIYHKYKSVIMSPKAFMEKPIRWFEVISEFKASSTAGPNSAYALCAKIIKEQELIELDLTSLKYALNGSEVINNKSLKYFAEKFEKCNFNLDSFCPAYGLAESTMFVSGSNRNLKMKKINYEDFKKNLFIESNSGNKNKKELIGTGKLYNASKAVIVNIATGKECMENEIGEICLQNDSIAQGYWNMPDETEQIFKMTLENHSGNFLRTGDLGIIVEENLYITGRFKEIIIINGHNLYPQDIETSLKEKISLLKYCTMVIFSINIQEKEKIVIGIEINQKDISTKELTMEINGTMRKEFDIVPYEVYYVKDGELPRTDNGKIQVFSAKQIYENSVYSVNSYLNEVAIAQDAENLNIELLDAVERRVKDVFTKVITDNGNIGMNDSFFNLGGDSLDTVHLVTLLESEFEMGILLKEIVEFPTIKGISAYIKAKKNKNELIITNKDYLYEDCNLPEEIIPGGYRDFDNVNPKNIFITGSTGFLGAHLIKDLIEKSKAYIYCHVRAKDDENGIKRIKENMEKYKCWEENYISRVKPVLGDLSKPRMGIEENYYNELAEKIDMVYHNGALLNFIFPYNHLKNTNVFGTVECLRFACKNKPKYFNYISTFSVYDNPSHFKTQALENNELESADGYFLGYSESKWVSEKLVRIAEKRGLKVSIYRPGDITGASTTGIWNMSDLVSRVIVACIQMRAIPNIGANIYITPVDFVSKAITALSMKKESVGKAFNIVNKNIATVIELHAIINLLGYHTEIIPYKEWQQLLLNGANDSVLKILECLFTADDSEETSIIRRYGDMEADFDITNTLNGLRDTNISCPKLGLELIFKYLDNFANQGYIEHPINLRSTRQV